MSRLYLSVLGTIPLLSLACSGSTEPAGSNNAWAPGNSSGSGGTGSLTSQGSTNTGAGNATGNAAGATVDADGNPVVNTAGTGTTGAAGGGNTTTAAGTGGTTADSNDPIDANDPTTTGGVGVEDYTEDDPDPEVLEALANAEALPMTLSGEPLFARTVRLTHTQWERSVRYLLQLDGPTGQQSGLTDDALALKDFSNNETLLVVSGTLWNDYATAASTLAASLAADETRLSAIYAGTDADGFITTFGRQAFRRPLTAAEVAEYQALYDTGAALSEGGASEFARGIGLVVEGILQSPNFLYRVELTAPGERLSGYEIAAKLSLLLRGITPDDALLDAAAAGELDSNAAITTLATQMVEEDNLTEVMREYHGDLFKFNRYLTIEKDGASVPQWAPELKDELQESAYLFFDRILTSSLGVRDIFTSNIGFMGPEMAALYGESAPASGFGEVTLDATRPGFFTQLPFLIVNSVNLVPDSIHRGVALNLEILCAEVPAPPAGADLTSPSSGTTNREKVTSKSGEGTCGASCHGPYINPLGFAFENFDGMGQVRDTDNGEPVDTSAEYPFTEGLTAYADAPGLMAIIAEGEQAHDCYSKHLAGFALQRDLNADDSALVDSLSASSRAPSSSIKQMLLTLVTDPAFTTRTAGGAQ